MEMFAHVLRFHSGHLASSRGVLVKSPHQLATNSAHRVPCITIGHKNLNKHFLIMIQSTQWSWSTFFSPFLIYQNTQEVIFFFFFLGRGIKLLTGTVQILNTFHILRTYIPWPRKEHLWYKDNGENEKGEGGGEDVLAWRPGILRLSVSPHVSSFHSPLHHTKSQMGPAHCPMNTAAKCIRTFYNFNWGLAVSALKTQRRFT